MISELYRPLTAVNASLTKVNDQLLNSPPTPVNKTRAAFTNVNTSAPSAEQGEGLEAQRKVVQAGCRG